VREERQGIENARGEIVELWDNEIGAILLPESLTSWVPGAESAKTDCRKAFSPARILSRQSCGGNYSFVWLPLSPSDFCLNGGNYCCGWSSVKSVGSETGSLTHRGTAVLTKARGSYLSFPVWTKAGRKLEVIDVSPKSGTVLGDFSFSM